LSLTDAGLTAYKMPRAAMLSLQLDIIGLWQDMVVTVYQAFTNIKHQGDVGARRWGSGLKLPQQYRRFFSEPFSLHTGHLPILRPSWY
jgi:hypothetical protein